MILREAWYVESSEQELVRLLQDFKRGDEQALQGLLVGLARQRGDINWANRWKQQVFQAGRQYLLDHEGLQEALRLDAEVFKPLHVILQRRTWEDSTKDEDDLERMILQVEATWGDVGDLLYAFQHDIVRLTDADFGNIRPDVSEVLDTWKMLKHSVSMWYQALRDLDAAGFQREATRKQANERNLASLLRAHELDPSIETAGEVLRAYGRAGKLPPLDWEWVEELEEEGEPLPEYEIQEASIHYVVDEAQSDEGETYWVPWEYGEEKERPIRQTIAEIVWAAVFLIRNPNADDFHLVTDAYDAPPAEGGKKKGPFIKVTFSPQPTSGGPYEETQQDILLYLLMTEENAKQIWEWVEEAR